MSLERREKGHWDLCERYLYPLREDPSPIVLSEQEVAAAVRSRDGQQSRRPGTTDRIPFHAAPSTTRNFLHAPPSEHKIPNASPTRLFFARNSGKKEGATLVAGELVPPLTHPLPKEQPLQRPLAQSKKGTHENSYLRHELIDHGHINTIALTRSWNRSYGSFSVKGC
jgi:hypothetical protein